MCSKPRFTLQITDEGIYHLTKSCSKLRSIKFKTCEVISSRVYYSSYHTLMLMINQHIQERSLLNKIEKIKCSWDKEKEDKI